MTGIICAMESEAKRLKSEMRGKTVKTISGIEFTKGKLRGKDTVIAVCGVGKVFAALCAEIMILKYSVDTVFNIGVAGRLSKKLGPGHLAIATSTVQYDYDTSALGDIEGMISGIGKINMVCDRTIVTRLREIADEREIKYVCGVIATGDKFLTDRKIKDHLIIWFGAIACDMESGAIGQTCFVNGVDYCVIRAVTDGFSGNEAEEYAKYLDLAADNAAQLILAYYEEPVKIEQKDE